MERAVHGPWGSWQGHCYPGFISDWGTLFYEIKNHRSDCGESLQASEEGGLAAHRHIQTVAPSYRAQWLNQKKKSLGQTKCLVFAGFYLKKITEGE